MTPSCSDLRASSNNFSALQSQTNFTPIQLYEYSRAYTNLICGDSIASRVSSYGLTISGLVGFFSYFLMLASLIKSKLSLSPCTMIYHQTLILFELPHMVVMANFGLLLMYRDSLDPTHNFALRVWIDTFVYGWHIGDMFKLAVSMLTAFLSLERFIAVGVPNRFEMINRKGVAYVAVSVSILVGSLHLLAVLSRKVIWDENTKEYVAYTTEFGRSDFFSFVGNLINGIKIGLCIVIFILCCATAVCLKLRARKIFAMSSGAKQEWRIKRRACVFSFIVGACILVDHAMWVAHKIVSKYAADFGDMTVERVVEQQWSYEEAWAQLNEGRMVVITGHAQGWMGQLVHGWRFFIYLGLNKMMRDGFVRAVCCRKSNAISNHGSTKI